MAKLSVVVPCYNEAKNIPLVLQSFGKAINRPDVELLLVDNGSTDETAEVLSDELPKYSFAGSIRVPVNQGYGYGILAGLRAVALTSEFIGWTHADLQTDPADVLRALDLIEANDCSPHLYVKGLRQGRSLTDNFFTLGMSLFESLLLGAILWDINAQPNIFHRSFFEGWSNPPHDFSLDLYAFYQAHRQKLKLKRFPVLFVPRIHGESKWNTGLSARLKFIRRTLSFSFELKRRTEAEQAGKIQA